MAWNTAFTFASVRDAAVPPLPSDHSACAPAKHAPNSTSIAGDVVVALAGKPLLLSVIPELYVPSTLTGLHCTRLAPLAALTCDARTFAVPALLPDMNTRAAVGCAVRSTSPNHATDPLAGLGPVPDANPAPLAASVNRKPLR